MDDSVWESAGLLDPRSPFADKRRALLQFLTEEGVSVDEMVAADRAGRLALAVGDDRVLGRPRRLTFGQAAEQSGLNEQALRQFWSDAGLSVPPDDRPVLSDDDVETVRLLGAVDTIFGPGGLSEVARVAGPAIGQLAEAEVSMYVRRAAPRAAQRGGEVELAKARLQITELLPGAAKLLDLLHRHHILAAIRRLGLTTASVAAGTDVAHLAIGFADLAGYTEFTRRTRPGSLRKALDQFRESVQAVARENDIRIVKLIGDGVMFAAVDAEKACKAAARLCELIASKTQLTELRAAVAAGDVVVRDGDYFGTVVNLAARLVSAAQPGQLVVDAATAERLKQSGVSVDEAGVHHLKGIGDVEVFVVDRGDTWDDPSGAPARPAAAPPPTAPVRSA